MPKVAQELLAYCTRCRLDLIHVIVSMDGGAIAKTQCKSCGGVHGFRSPKNSGRGPERERVRRTRKSEDPPRKKVAPVPDGDLKRWSELVEARSGEETRPYAIHGSFAEGDLIRHPVFGKGVVTAVPGPQKILVHFDSGMKLLAQGR